MVTLTFLGTGGDAIVVGKQERASGGIILKDSSFQFHIDPGPGSLVRAKEYGVNLRETTAIFITSPDIIHANDMGASVMAMTHGGLDKKGSLYALEHYSIEAKEHASSVDKLILLSPGKKEYYRDFDIIPTPCQNILPRIGLRIALGMYTLGYPGDTTYTDAIADKYKGCHLLILHCRTPTHLQDIEHFLTHTQPKLAIITYFGVKILEEDPFLHAKELTRKTHIKTLAAIDGDTFDLNDLFSNKNQTPLTLFLNKQ